MPPPIPLRSSGRLLTAAMAILAHAHTPHTSAQDNATPDRNLVANGDMEQFKEAENRWDGVQSNGNITGENINLVLVTESAEVRPSPVPPSLAIADLDGNGLSDMIFADSIGYLRVYFNQGTRENPVFTHNELVNAFVCSPPHRRAPRISLANFSGNQRPLDLLLGNYLGEIQLLPANNTGRAFAWSSPESLGKITIPTYSGNRLWGNLFAPLAADMNADGNLDLLIGEGSYSANSIHLLLNQGNQSNPRYDENHRHYLVLGNGREHLSPALVDANGDPYPDLLVGDREGQVTLHIHPGGSWRPGEELPTTSILSFGGRPTLGQAVSPAAHDMNGDGAFDLVCGMANGFVQIAYNTGSSAEPVFAKPQQIQGQNVPPIKLRTPAIWRWTQNTGLGNARATIHVVTTDEDPQLNPPSGRAALRMGYLPSLNEILPPFNPADIPRSNENQTIQRFTLRTNRIRLKNNASYTLTFFSKGTGIEEAEWSLTASARVAVGEARIERRERGIVERRQETRADEFTESGSISQGSSWSRNSTRFTVRFDDRKLRELDRHVQTELLFSVIPRSDSGALYIDNVSIVENN